VNLITAKKKCVDLEAQLERIGIRANIRATDEGLSVVVKSYADKLIARRELTARGCRIASIDIHDLLCA